MRYLLLGGLLCLTLLSTCSYRNTIVVENTGDVEIKFYIHHACKTYPEYEIEEKHRNILKAYQKYIDQYDPDWGDEIYLVVEYEGKEVVRESLPKSTAPVHVDILYKEGKPIAVETRKVEIKYESSDSKKRNIIETDKGKTTRFIFDKDKHDYVEDKK